MHVFTDWCHGIVTEGYNPEKRAEAARLRLGIQRHSEDKILEPDADGKNIDKAGKKNPFANALNISVALNKIRKGGEAGVEESKNLKAMKKNMHDAIDDLKNTKIPGMFGE